MASGRLCIQPLPGYLPVAATALNASIIRKPVGKGWKSDMLAWEQGKIIHVGAEAEVSNGHYLGLAAVRKLRRPRGYRDPALDRRLTNHRMAAEAKMLARLSNSGLPVPHLLACEMSNGTMIQSLVPGSQLVDVLRDGEFDVKTVMLEVGKVIRQLHSVGAVHGDLTTNNILWDGDNGISLIDFGLSQSTTEVERMGLDLQVLSECLSASHPEHEDALEWVFDGYNGAENLTYTGSDSPPVKSEEVINRYNTIRSRVRYHS
ncbi:MAG: KEOPS complex kinase/ATPase Bud32 [Candidatus Thalassarchaeaceae archaeon]|nr:KEOPS complex kinase/ATPase Bud32 [Candidatus Thalassarchaeaceae archaeon]